jgi:hypothetical protein
MKTARVPIVAHSFKIAIVIAIYWTAYALFGRFGIASCAAAFVCGSALSAIIVLIRRQNLTAVARFTSFTIAGALIGATCLGQIILRENYLYDHGQGESAMSMFLGGLFGTLFGALLAEILPKSQG